MIYIPSLIALLLSTAMADKVATPSVVSDSYAEAAPPAKPCYFQYQNGGNENLPPDLISRMMKGKDPGSVMIGGDPGLGNMPGDEGFWRAMVAAEKAKARKHVYLMGPGGPTGTSGVEDELLVRMTAAAKGEGIDLRTTEGMKKWNRDGWKNHLFKQLKYFNGANPQKIHMDSFEIDNLYRARLEGPALIEFYKELQTWLTNNNVKMTVLPKNLSLFEWELIQKAIQKGSLKRELFSDFAIQEVDSLSAERANRQREAARVVGVEVVDSKNTYDYRAQGGSCAPKSSKK